MAGRAGLGLGGLGGVLVSSDGLGGGDRTGQDIADGCAILERLKDDLPAEEGSVTLEEPLLFELGAAEIGRASCRERVEARRDAAASRDKQPAAAREGAQREAAEAGRE